MHVTKKVAQWIEELTQSLDKRNQRTLVQLVLSASKARTLSVSRLGRHLVSQALPKHAIKRVDRWLSNRSVQQKVDAVYAELIGKLMGPGSRPVLVVDWTESGPKHYALVAALW